MVVEYKIRFEDDEVIVTQTVDGVSKDFGGAGNTVGPDGGGAGNTVGPDGGGAGSGGKVLAVVLGPLIIRSAGVAKANREEKPIEKPRVFGLGAVNP